MKILEAVVWMILSAGFASAVAAPDPDSLSAAFLAQCQRMQTCLNEEILARPDMDPAMVTMIQTRMQGQCEAQLPSIAQYENLPRAVDMKACFTAMAALSCEELKQEPQLAECDI